MRHRQVLITLCILLAPGLLLAPVWRMGGLGAGEDDILYYYPSRVFFAESIRDGHIPWINPWIGLGRPYAADPQSALWYPFTWMFAVVPPEYAYGASLWLHYSLAIWGMYRLLRWVRLDRRAALFGGIAFAFSGFMLAHRVHFTMQNAAAWTPWILWRLGRYAESSGPEGARKSAAGRLLAAALVCAMQCFAGHTQIAAITALASLVFVAARNGVRLIVVRRWFLTWLCTAGLYAIQWMPTLAYLSVCEQTRSKDYWLFTQNSWEPAAAIMWLLPMLFGQRTPNVFDQTYWGPSHQCEMFAYSGILPLLLAALVIRRGCRSDRNRWALLLVGLFGLLLALGKYGPLYPVMYLLPGREVFRAPARAIFLVNLAIAGLSAFGLHDLLSAHRPERVRLRASAQALIRRPILFAAMATLAPMVFVFLAFPFANAATRTAILAAVFRWPPNPAIYVPLLMLAWSAEVLRTLAHGSQRLGLIWTMFAVLLIDLGIIAWHIDVPASHPTFDELTNPPAREEWLKFVRGSPHRLWCVTDSDGIYHDPLSKGAANTNSLVHVASLTDYGPLQPSNFMSQFKFAFWGASGITEQLLRDTDWMKYYDVGWILLCEPRWPAPANCEFVTRTSDGKRLFKNTAAGGGALLDGATAKSRIYLGPNMASAAPDTVTVVADTSESREADPGIKVVISRLFIPGWEIPEDSGPRPIESTHGALLATRVSANEQIAITWNYETPRFALGSTISIVTLGLLLLAAGVSRPALPS